MTSASSATPLSDLSRSIYGTMRMGDESIDFDQPRPNLQEFLNAAAFPALLLESIKELAISQRLKSRLGRPLGRTLCATGALGQARNDTRLRLFS